MNEIRHNYLTDDADIDWDNEPPNPLETTREHWLQWIEWRTRQDVEAYTNEHGHPPTEEYVTSVIRVAARAATLVDMRERLSADIRPPSADDLRAMADGDLSDELETSRELLAYWQANAAAAGPAKSLDELSEHTIDAVNAHRQVRECEVMTDALIGELQRRKGMRP